MVNLYILTGAVLLAFLGGTAAGAWWAARPATSNGALMNEPPKGTAGLDVATLAGYVLLSLVQFAAIHDGLRQWMHLGDLFTLLVSLPLALSPGGGAILASLGAMQAWGWSGFGTFGLFGGLSALLVLYAARSGLVKVALRFTEED
jgi:hypothetical protein